MIAKIGSSDIARVIRTLENNRSTNSVDSTISDRMAEEDAVQGEDRIDLQRDGDLDPETLRLIDQILTEGEDGN